MGKKIERYGIIYRIINEVNGKVYIGQTVKNFKKRYGGNLISRTHNEHLRNAIIKYGIESFKIEECIAVAYSKEELDEMENYYINLHKSIDARFGYNKMTGGASGKPTQEIKNKMSQKFREVNGVSVICINTLESFGSIVEASEKTGCSTSGINLCCNRKISQVDGLQWLYHKDYLKGEKPLEMKDRRVICITTNEVFRNITEASEKYKTLTIGGILNCCNLSYGSYGVAEDGRKMQWLYYKDYLNGMKPKKITDRRVICTTTGKMFDSAMQAGDYYKIDSSHISERCKNKKGFSGIIKGRKLQWLYYKDYLRGSKVEELIDTRIICLNTLEIFESAGKLLKN